MHETALPPPSASPAPCKLEARGKRAAAPALSTKLDDPRRKQPSSGSSWLGFGGLPLFIALSAGCGRLMFDPIFEGDAEAPPALEATPPFADDADLADSAGELDAAETVDAAPDVTTDPDASSLDSALPTCAGEIVIGSCWYMAGNGTSCTTACKERGGVDHAALASVGTSSEGGSQSNCRAVLAALGKPAPVYSWRNDDLGFGCHVWKTGRSYWSDDPTRHFDADLEGYTATSMTCPCLR